MFDNFFWKQFSILQNKKQENMFNNQKTENYFLFSKTKNVVFQENIF